MSQRKALPPKKVVNYRLKFQVPVEPFAMVNVEGTNSEDHLLATVKWLVDSGVDRITLRTQPTFSEPQWTTIDLEKALS